jgi:uncharacterized protein YlxW (UPF0749 family)
MTEAQRIGLLMLTWCCQRPEPKYHAMSDALLRDAAKSIRREVNMLAQHVNDCQALLDEAEREHEYQTDQLELVEGIIEVRRLNRMDECSAKASH